MTDKLQGISPGDRVRVTFEGVYRDGYRFQIDDITGDDATTYFASQEINAPTFHIERIEQPLKVGDRVRFKPDYGDHRVSYELVAFREGQCVLWGPLESGMSSVRGADPVWLERKK